MDLYVLAVILVLAQGSQAAEQCTGIGVQCDSACLNVVYCGSVGAAPIPVVTCPSEKYCFMNETTPASCSSDRCSNAPHPFKCLQEGTFPSAYQCDTFYICTAVGGAPQRECKCGDGEKFDTPTQSCRTQDCPRTPAKCDTPGAEGVLDTAYCYTCDGNYNALVHRCFPTARAWEPTVSTRAATCGPYTGPRPFGFQHALH